MEKIDKNLKKVIALDSQDKTFTCLLYVNNLQKAKNFFELNNIKIIRQYKFLNLIATCLSTSQIYNFANQNFVDYIAQNSCVLAQNYVSRNIIQVDNLKADGSSVCVAIVDTGISNHFDFVIGKNRVIKFVDLVNQKQNPYDDNGHGTFVAGVLAGSGLMSFGKYKGFAPSCNIVSIKALDKKGEANAIKILDAFEWIYLNHKSYNIKVVCMSFGSEPIGYNDPIMKGAEKLWNSGIVVVAAAGNSGPKYQTIKSPGISPKIITVGGFDDNRVGEDFDEKYFEIAEFSSRGPAFAKIKPDMVAPSVDIVSCGLNNTYTKLSGTSVSAPMIAGICADIIQKKPGASPDLIKRFLMSNCKAIVNNFNQEGRGFLSFDKFNSGY